MPIGMDTISEVDIFESIELNDHVGCSYGDCDREATHMLECPEDKAAETICKEHAMVFQIVGQTLPNEVITFDNTCGHSPKISECQILPLAK
jgi:hypothetical protein